MQEPTTSPTKTRCWHRAAAIAAGANARRRDCQALKAAEHGGGLDARLRAGATCSTPRQCADLRRQLMKNVAGYEFRARGRFARTLGMIPSLAEGNSRRRRGTLCFQCTRWTPIKRIIDGGAPLPYSYGVVRRLIMIRLSGPIGVAAEGAKCGIGVTTLMAECAKQTLPFFKDNTAATLWRSLHRRHRR